MGASPVLTEGPPRASPPPTCLGPYPLPRLRRARAPASSAPPAPGSLQSPPVADPGSLPGAPAPFQAGECLRGSAGQRGRPRRGPWAPQLAQPGRRPHSRSRHAGTGKDGAAGAAHQPRQSRLGPPGCLSSSPPPVGEGKVAVAAPCPGGSEYARAKMAYIQVGLGLGGQGPRVGVGRPRPPPHAASARKGGQAAGLPRTCLDNQGARAQTTCVAVRVRPRRRGWGPQHPGMKDPGGLRTRALASWGKRKGGGGLFCTPAPHPLTLPLVPHLRGGAAGKAARDRPAAVAVVTAPANWPAG